MAAVIDARSREVEEQRERALRALLWQPLMSKHHRAFGLVRAHADYLRDWLARECGWVLRVERECARLFKRPSNLADSRRGAAGFDRNRYALLCLALAVLEREDLQITLRQLGEYLIAEAAAPELAATGFTFTLDRQSERRDLVRVCRLLLELGIIGRVAGDEQAYINRSGDALYDIHRPLLAALLAGDRGPSALTGVDDSDFDACLQALAAENTPEGEGAQRSALRHRLSRRLLDDPVVYLDELDAAERSALVDEAGDLTDAPLPQQGTDAHATLLLADFLAERLRAGDNGPVPEAEIHAFLREAARAHRKYWRKSAQEAGAERELAAVALNRLEALRLVRRRGGTVHPLPAVCRFRLGESRVKQKDLLGN